MNFDDIEERAGAHFCAALDRFRRCCVLTDQTLRILPDHQLFLERVRQEGQPLIELCALWRSDLRRKPGAAMLIDKMKHDGSGLRQDQTVIYQSRDTPVRIELEIFLGFLSVLAPVDEQKLIFGAKL